MQVGRRLRWSLMFIEVHIVAHLRWYHVGASCIHPPGHCNVWQDINVAELTVGFVPRSALRCQRGRQGPTKGRDTHQTALEARTAGQPEVHKPSLTFSGDCGLDKPGNFGQKVRANSKNTTVNLLTTDTRGRLTQPAIAVLHPMRCERFGEP